MKSIHTSFNKIAKQPEIAAETMTLANRGNLLDSKIIPRTTEDYLLNCSELASGIYFFQIKSQNGAYASGKFVVN